MTWHIDGVGADISLSVSSEGYWSVSGYGPHQCHPTGGDFDFLSTVKRVKEMSWRFFSPGAPVSHVDPVSPQLWNKFQAEPQRSVAKISYLHGDRGRDGMLSATAMLSESMSIAMFDLAKTILGRKDIRYRILFDFMGLRVPESDADVPSVAEFLHHNILSARPYLCEDFTFILPDRPLPS